MPLTYTIVTDPAEEPVTTAEAKSHAVIQVSADDTLIDSYIKAARLYGETRLDRQFVTATWDWFMDEFPAAGDPLRVPLPPLRSIGSIKYLDADGVEQTWASSKYRVDSDSEPGRITPAWDESWPITRGVTNSVTVRFDAGYGLAVDVPESIKNGIRVLVAHWYESREPVVIGRTVANIPFAADALFDLEAWTVLA